MELSAVRFARADLPREPSPTAGARADVDEPSVRAHGQMGPERGTVEYLDPIERPPHRDCAAVRTCDTVRPLGRIR